MDHLTESYVNAVSSTVENNGGERYLARVGQEIPRPPALTGKLSKFMLRRGDRFSLVRTCADGNTVLIRSIRKGTKVSGRVKPSLFALLHRMTKRHKDWPQKAMEWDCYLDSLDMPQYSPVSTLKDLQVGSYVQWKGKLLLWNKSRIFEHVYQKIQDHAKNEPENEIVPDSVKSSEADSTTESTNSTTDHDESGSPVTDDSPVTEAPHSRGCIIA